MVPSPPKPGLRVRVLAFLIWLLARLLLCTVRLRVDHLERLEQARGPGSPILFAFWHGRQLALFKANPERRLAVVASLSRDGQLQAQVCRHFGLQVVRGSSSRAGLAAMVALGKRLKDGVSVGVAVDGPRGPLHQAKAGIVALARTSGAPLLPMTVGFKRAWTLRRAWDQFQIPKPFTRATVAYGEPLWVERDASSARIGEVADQLGARLRELTVEADRAAAA